MTTSWRALTKSIGAARVARSNVDARIIEYFLCELELPLKKRRMQSAGGRSGGDMLGDLRIF